jgi:hypothetical protein
MTAPTLDFVLDILPKARLDPPRHFAAYLHALRWNTVTATDALETFLFPTEDHRSPVRAERGAREEEGRAGAGRKAASSSASKKREPKTASSTEAARRKTRGKKAPPDGQGNLGWE